MPAYEITSVAPEPRAWKAQGKYDMFEYRVDLRGPNSEGAVVDVPNVEWSRKKESPAPRVGQTLDVEKFESKQQGLKLHLAQQLGGGGHARNGASGGSSRDFKADPVKQAAIAMEAAQKASVEIVRLALENDRSADGIAADVRTVAASLFEQIQAEMKAAQ